MSSEGPFNSPPWLTISGEFEIVEPQPVPEPVTIFGSVIALGVGGWLKRKNLTGLTHERYI